MNTTYAEELAAKLAALDALAANFGQVLDKSLTAMWLELLNDYTGLEVKQACLQVIQTYPYHHLPPFAVLKKELDKLRGVESAEDLRKRKALAEWVLVWEETGNYNPYDGRRQTFCPTTEYVIRALGGWDTICSTWLESDRTWRQKEFVEAWVIADGKTELMEQGALALEAHRQAALAGQLAPGAEQLSIDADQTPQTDHEPAENCPDCGGSGWIHCWKPDNPQLHKARCQCNVKPEDVAKTPNAWTRAELVEKGFVFTPQRAPMRSCETVPAGSSFRDRLDNMRRQAGLEPMQTQEEDRA